MAKEIINVGQAANDGTGDPLRNAFEKVNSNFTELYDTADTQDLDFTGDSGTGAVELDSQTLNLVGTNGVQTTANGQTITIDTSSLDTRLTTAEADIDTNTASITTEETARIAADTTLQTNIDAEATTRGSADTTLQTNIDSEAATRLANDNTLQSNIDAEAATRLANDNTLQSNIDAEASTRGLADTTLQTNIDNEETARIAADLALQTQITSNDTDITALQAADVTLQSNIDSEASTRASADTALQGQIDSNDTDIATNAANIATNTANISSNDTDISGLDSRLTTAEGNISSNDTDIATNVTNISTNVTNIATNATDISTNVTNIASNDTDISNLQSGKQDISEKNQANGYAPLDSGAKIPIANLPDSVVGQVEYQGTWDASIDDPTLPSASTVKGHYYVVSVGGTYETITYAIGDWIISNGVAWEKIDNTDAVTTVFGRLGAIVANEGDYSSYYPLIADLTAAETDIATNATNISSNDTDITDLQTDKYDKSGGTISGNATITGDFNFGDNNKAIFGTDSDLKIYHTGSASIIEDVGQGDLVIKGTDLYLRNDANSNRLYAGTDVRLYYNGAEKIRTTSTGASVTGNLIVDTNTLYVDSTNNRVGIGTASPSAKLDVSGDGVFQSTSSTNDLEIKAGLAGATSGTASLTLRPLSSLTGTSYARAEITSVSPSAGDADLILKTTTDNTGPQERMRIDSSGNVGIGTVSPTSILEISKNDQTNGAVLSITNSFDGNDWNENDIIGTIDFKITDPSTAQKVRGQIKVFDDATPSGTFPAYNAMSFSTANVGVLSERMRIDSSGRVGIGTTSPDSLLDVSSNSTPTIRITNTSQLSTSYTVGAFEFYTEDASTPGGARVLSSILCDNNIGSSVPNGELVFSTALGGGSGAAATEKMRIDSNGNVGIGSESPSAKLEVEGTDAKIRINNTTGTIGDLTILDLTGLVLGSGIGNERSILLGQGGNPSRQAKISYSQNSSNGQLPNLSFFTGDNVDSLDERMRITSAGNVGIGSDSPSAKLEITAPNSNTFLSNITSTTSANIHQIKNDNSKGIETVIYSSAYSGGTYLNVGADGSVITGNSKTAITTTGAFDLLFGTNSTPRMRILSGGSVLVGKATDDDNTNGIRLAQVGAISASRPSNVALILNRTGSDGAIALFRKDSTQVGSISVTGSATNYATSSDYRLKENVVEMTGALDRVDALKPSRFNFIADAEKTVDGFLAHEVAEVVPEAISGEKDAVEDYEVTPAVLDDEGNVIEEAVMGTRPVYQGIDQSKLVPLLVGAIQELKAEIETLKSQINN